jgi:xanthine dehydrogenase accessory factor
VLVERLSPGEETLAHLSALEAALTGQRPALRHVDLTRGAAYLEDDAGLGERVIWPPASSGESPRHVQLRVGPVARLVLAGMSPVAEACAEFAQRLGFEVIVCDPRPETLDGLSLPGVERVATLPSTYIAGGGCHAATAVVALTHDPRLDDLTMIEAVTSEAFYIGVMGSRKTSAARAERLKRSGGLDEAALARIHMPIGLGLGSKTPAEIALAVMADIVRVRRGRARDDL